MGKQYDRQSSQRLPPPSPPPGPDQELRASLKCITSFNPSDPHDVHHPRHSGKPGSKGGRTSQALPLVGREDRVDPFPGKDSQGGQPWRSVQAPQEVVALGTVRLSRARPSLQEDRARTARRPAQGQGARERWHPALHCQGEAKPWGHHTVPLTGPWTYYSASAGGTPGKMDGLSTGRQAGRPCCRPPKSEPQIEANASSDSTLRLPPRARQSHGQDRTWHTTPPLPR